MRRCAGYAIGLVTGLGLLAPGTLLAQATWTVIVTPGKDTLPIGACSAVALKVVDPKTRETPRDPTGSLISMADFDMTVSAADGKSVAGQYLDKSHWRVCGCQGAAIGTVGTITARYPGQLLTERTRVARVTSETSATFVLGKPDGAWNPPECPRALQAGVTAKGVQPPLTTAPAGTRVPVSPAAGAPATGVAVSGTPLIANVTWTAAPGATRYAVLRKDDAQLSVQRTPAGFTATRFTDTLPDPRITYRYTVVAYYADGTSGEAPAVQYISPPLVNPSGLTAEHLGLGEVKLEWQPVPGAVTYRIDGPGLPAAGEHTSSTSFGYTSPWGAASWKVTALYPGNFADYVNGATVATVIRVLPAHPGQWLTKSNGPGTADHIQTPRRPGGCASDLACGWVNPGLLVPWNGLENRWLGLNLPDLHIPNVMTSGLLVWLNVSIPLWDDSAQWGREAVYGNLGDLGFGRRTACWQGLRGPPNPDFVTICYAAAHGAGPGEPGFADPAAVTQPAEGKGPGFILAMVIVKDATGSVFMAFGRDQLALERGWDTQKYALLPEVTLDTEGPKFVPFACLSCHGGKYNPQTRKVEGSHFLPLDPGLLAFASPAAQAGEEEKIRQINQMIVTSDPQSAVAAYIRGLYRGAVHQPGTRAQPDYIPPGWAAQSGFYRSVVKPYCAMCHIAGPSYLNFTSWQNFEDNKALIHAAVCRGKTMPHAELQFNAFWTRDTGPTYTPGLLAATLGYPSCQ